MTFSFQLYSARDFQPWEQVLPQLAALGYTNVEGYGAMYEDPKGFKALMDTHGLNMPSGHFGFDLLKNNLADALAIAETLGCHTLFCPHLAADQRPSDQAGWQAFAHDLAAIGKKAKEAGKNFGWHNHDFEFQACADGSLPMQIILENAPEITWEADLAWIARGGADPFEWIDTYGMRIAAVHVKDIAPEGACLDEDGWADVGHGTLDWQGLMDTLRAKSQASLFIMEHDKPNDYQRFAQRSIMAAQSY